MTSNAFWPVRKGDNHCPKCDSELFIVEDYADETGHIIMYKLRCFECGETYILSENIRSGMEVNLHELPRGRFV